MARPGEYRSVGNSRALEATGVRSGTGLEHLTWPKIEREQRFNQPLDAAGEEGMRALARRHHHAGDWINDDMHPVYNAEAHRIDGAARAAQLEALGVDTTSARRTVRARLQAARVSRG